MTCTRCGWSGFPKTAPDELLREVRYEQCKLCGYLVTVTTIRHDDEEAARLKTRMKRPRIPANGWIRKKYEPES